MSSFTRVEKLPKGSDYGYKITQFTKQPKLLKWFGFKDYETVYVGSPTVFYEYPSGSRCGTSTEYWLCEVVEAHKMETNKLFKS